jgi:hypothetical protein
MTRIASKFGIAAALTLGVLSTAAAQRNPPTTTEKISKGDVVVTRVDTVWRRDTITVTNTIVRRDTVTVNGATITRYDTTTVMEVPGWLEMGSGKYFGLGAGAYYPSAGIGQGQIPGYAVQANFGIDPAGSPLGVRLTAQLARPDETSQFANLGARPTIMNITGDLKLRLPMFRSTRFPQFGLYGIGGLAYIRYNGLREQKTTGDQFTPTVNPGTHDTFGYTVGGGGTLGLGHKRELFLELRVINFNKSGYEGAHQFPVILGLNWF